MKRVSVVVIMFVLLLMFGCRKGRSCYHADIIDGVRTPWVWMYDERGESCPVDSVPDTIYKRYGNRDTTMCE
jgi:hypothetical protein